MVCELNVSAGAEPPRRQNGSQSDCSLTTSAIRAMLPPTSEPPPFGCNQAVRRFVPY